MRPLSRDHNRAPVWPVQVNPASLLLCSSGCSCDLASSSTLAILIFGLAGSPRLTSSRKDVSKTLSSGRVQYVSCVFFVLILSGARAGVEHVAHAVKKNHVDGTSFQNNLSFFAQSAFFGDDWYIPDLPVAQCTVHTRQCRKAYGRLSTCCSSVPF